LSDILPQLPTLPALHADAVNASASSQSSGSSIGDILGGIATGNPYQVASGVTGGPTTPNKIGALLSGLGADITWGRVAAFLVGILLLGAGVLAFKQTQVIVGNVARGAAL